MTNKWYANNEKCLYYFLSRSSSADAAVKLEEKKNLTKVDREKNKFGTPLGHHLSCLVYLWLSACLSVWLSFYFLNLSFFAPQIPWQYKCETSHFRLAKLPMFTVISPNQIRCTLCKIDGGEEYWEGIDESCQKSAGNDDGQLCILYIWWIWIKVAATNWFDHDDPRTPMQAGWFCASCWVFGIVVSWLAGWQSSH